MKRFMLRELFLLCLCIPTAKGEGLPDVCLRFHEQWKVGAQEQQELQKEYGALRVSFDEKGRATPCGLSHEQLSRWKSFYELCMRDGCYYCDASEGSCESGTCGPKNTYCKPYLDKNGNPTCGTECADYAFKSTRI